MLQTSTSDQKIFQKTSIKMMIVLFGCILNTNLFAQEALRADGKIIENTSNKEVILKGVNLGQWLLMEGFMSGSAGDITQVDMKRKIYNDGKSRAYIESLFDQYRANYITKADIDYIAAMGFNCVRLPIHYELFLTDLQREERSDVIYTDGTAKQAAYTDYKTKLGSWVTNNELAVSPNIDGFTIIDSLVSWCKAKNIYIVLDMHAIPGTIGSTRNITDEVYAPLDFFNDFNNRSALYRIWDKISERYKNENTICMYDLINEPHQRINNVLTSFSSAQMTTLRNAYNQIINDIRSNDDNKLILLQGDSYGNDYIQNNVSLFPSDFTNQANLVYNIHRYRADNSLTAMGATGNLSTLGNASAFRNTYNVPLFVGETGLDDDYARLQGNYEAFAALGIGWTLWTFKHHTDNTKNQCLFDIPGSDPWDDLNSWYNGTLFNNILFKNSVPNPQSDFWKAITSTLNNTGAEKPLLNFTNPANNSTIKQNEVLAVNVAATHATGVLNVILSLDGTFVRQENIAPYDWGANDNVLTNLTIGPHILTAVATARNGTTNTTSINIEVTGLATNVENNNVNDFKIYPNPASEIFYLSKKTTWNLYNTNGILLYSGKGTTVNITRVNNGVYLLKTPYQTFRIVVQH